MAVHELSKTVMYDAFYNKFKTFYGDRCELLYTDTDSLIVKIQTQDFYKDIKKHPGMFDTSKYAKDHPLFSDKNNEVLGKMKDECGGCPIKEFAALKTKMYSYIKEKKAEEECVK